MANLCTNSRDSPYTSTAPGSSLVQLSPAALVEYHRLQLYDYAQVASRFRFTHPAFVPAYPLSPYSDAQPPLPYGLSPFVRFDPRTRLLHEDPKPQQSYIGLIAKAILSSNEKKMVLSDIYQYILDNYPYFRNRGPGWRNSIRHNLSLNDCFIKAGRSANGKGHYWAIHPANMEDFKKGDFRRRKAQRKVRRHLGLAVPEEDDSPSPTPPPEVSPRPDRAVVSSQEEKVSTEVVNCHTRKRLFDVESLLAPDQGENDHENKNPTMEQRDDGKGQLQSQMAVSSLGGLALSVPTVWTTGQSFSAATMLACPVRPSVPGYGRPLFFPSPVDPIVQRFQSRVPKFGPISEEIDHSGL
ncbi:uncharacterized protein LOC143239327 [Tachypleus tridentatus]|uniref:uncharacterized protein LOC143239327 n=1 Tax=Tachypleus tridentatus TaxID=6853 RepID=UPI003FD671D9